ncbi:hypothetical protein Hdeb2414_s0020g00568581 [Helianthus debilis subsp. tardiflorus]
MVQSCYKSYILMRDYRDATHVVAARTRGEFYQNWFVKMGVLLSILAAMDILMPEHYWLDAAHVQQALQNILVVVKMISIYLYILINEMIWTICL